MTSIPSEEFDKCIRTLSRLKSAIVTTAMYKGSELIIRKLYEEASVVLEIDSFLDISFITFEFDDASFLFRVFVYNGIVYAKLLLHQGSRSQHLVVRHETSKLFTLETY